MKILTEEEYLKRLNRNTLWWILLDIFLITIVILFPFILAQIIGYMYGSNNF